MALVLIDRAQESATANTTVSFTMLGANTGYQTLAGVGDTNTTYYGATDGTNWEVGIGTYSTTGPTLTRTTILSSSNSNAAVSTFTSPLSVWVDYTASKAVTTDTLAYPPAIGGTTPAAGTFTTITGQTATLRNSQNLVTYSEDLTNANWAGVGTTVSIVSTAFATNTSQLVQTAGTAYLQNGFNQPSGVNVTGKTYTVSAWVWSTTDVGKSVGLRVTDTAGGVGVSTAIILTSTPTRYSATFTATSTAQNPAMLFENRVGNGGDGLAKTFFVWGAQLELAPTVGTYVKTIASTVYNPPALSFNGETSISLDQYGNLSVPPVGTGALQAQATTSSATGGNARGANAVDWQTTRATAAQVASGASAVLSGGINNTASGVVSTVAGGSTNISSSQNTFIGGGGANTASGIYSSIIGGLSNTSAGFYNFIGSGFTNSGTSGSAVTTNTTTIAVTAGTTLYLSSANASIRVGAYISATGVSSNTYATSTVTTGTAAVMATSTISGTTLTVGSLSSGTIIAGMVLTGTGVTAGTYIVSGSASTWTVSVSQTVSSTTITGTAYTFTISQAATTAAGVTLSFYTPHGVVVGGGNNQATGAYSFIGGGGDAGTASSRNVASGDWSVVVGGIKNTASGIAAYVGGGGIYNNTLYPNTASGRGSTVVGGISNLSSGDQSTIVGGFGSSASGAYGFIGGGFSNSVNSFAGSIQGGYYGTTRGIYGYMAFPACYAPISSSGGVTQAGLLLLGKQTTDATATALTCDGAAASNNNQVLLPNNSAYYFKGSVIANVTGAANGAAWSFEGAIMRGANAGSTVLIGTPQLNRVAATAGASTWVVALSADTTNGGLRVTVTGVAATTIRWVAKIETTEVTY